MAPPNGCGIEVRLHDFGWGPANDRNLLGRFGGRTFNLPRFARTQNYFPPVVRQFFAAPVFALCGRFARGLIRMHEDSVLNRVKSRCVDRTITGTQYTARDFQLEVLERLAEMQEFATSLEESWEKKLEAVKEQRLLKFDSRALIAMGALALSIGAYVGARRSQFCQTRQRDCGDAGASSTSGADRRYNDRSAHSDRGAAWRTARWAERYQSHASDA